MTDIMYLSKQYVPTLKEDPSDAEIASHRLLVRAGMIRKVTSGVYTYLPLGMKVLKKIEDIVREEMDEIGAREMLMPALQPGELWHESGRWDDYGPELMRLHDRHDREFCLGPTHEELITAIVRSELRSYRQLPLALYQIQSKFRDEIRPRFGLLRSREFIMKDAYSFHTDQESLQKTYDDMYEAYGRICDRLGLEYRPVEADPGQIGGSVTCEFMAIADAGEAELVYCPECDFAANTEAGACITHPEEYEVASCEKISTPGITTIAALAEFLHISEKATVKAMVGKNDEGCVVAVFIPGDHELNELKVQNAVPGFELLTDEEIEAAGLPKGSIGPKNLPEGILVGADSSLQHLSHWVVGANEKDYHFVGVQPGVDFEVDFWTDLCVVAPGDDCPHCGAQLEGARGIEVSQVFQLGDKYSRSMGAVYSAEDGTDQPFVMGCYGVGISRSLAAIVEQHNDELGIMWPTSVAPAQICVIPLSVGDETVYPVALDIAKRLANEDIEVVLDDRDERPGVKFADADLIGWPVQIVIGKRSVSQGMVEIKRRDTGDKESVAISAVIDTLSFVRRRRDKSRSRIL